MGQGSPALVDRNVGLVEGEVAFACLSTVFPCLPFPTTSSSLSEPGRDWRRGQKKQNQRKLRTPSKRMPLLCLPFHVIDDTTSIIILTGRQLPAGRKKKLDGCLGETASSDAIMGDYEPYPERPNLRYCTVPRNLSCASAARDPREKMW